MSKIVLQKWLLFRFVFLGDARAWQRLKALSRLRAREELKQLKETVQLAECLGLDPAPILESYYCEKIQILEEYLKGVPALRGAAC